MGNSNSNENSVLGKSREWFKTAGYGMMIHWGLYSLPAGEWKGRRMNVIGEWAQSYFRIPHSEYGRLAGIFDPILFDADEWVRVAKESGMKYFVITSKHHDGFALFHSKVDKYNLYDATPFKRDAIAEIAEACHKYGIKLGLYYSQDLDWHEPDGGGYTAADRNCGVMSWTNDWDYPDNSVKKYSNCFENKIKPQVKEILTNYGELCLIWFDTPRTISPEQSRELYDMVKSYQPGCLVNSRIGNGLGDYRSMGDNQIPDEYMKDGLFESPATLNDTWGYKSFDNNWKTPEKVISLRKHLNERGINYLLNVGPDYLGRIPAPAQEILRKAAEDNGCRL
ncbi:MAG: alpha-L-fucosidase [Eubacteriales bacterium]|nr:alpha-L-fucosidase [Eubacteriales bacterium]